MPCVQNAAGYAARLLKRGDQCKAVCTCARLAWQEDSSPAAAGGGKDKDEDDGVHYTRDASKVLSLLNRALKIAHSAKQQAMAAARPLPHVVVPPAGSAGSSGAAAAPLSYVSLYIEVLNHYLIYYELGVEAFTTSVVQQLLEVVQGEVVAGQSPLPGSTTGAVATDAETIRCAMHCTVNLSYTAALCVPLWLAVPYVLPCMEDGRLYVTRESNVHASAAPALFALSVTQSVGCPHVSDTWHVCDLFGQLLLLVQVLGSHRAPHHTAGQGRGRLSTRGPLRCAHHLASSCSAQVMGQLLAVTASWGELHRAASSLILFLLPEQAGQAGARWGFPVADVCRWNGRVVSKYQQHGNLIV